jgi:hypothetical protein
MRDKHFITALILLVLPLSFGGDSSTGTKAGSELDAASAKFRQSQKRTTHGFTAAEMAALLLAGTPIGNGDVARTSESFVSSFDVTRSREDARCGSATDVNGNPEIENLNADCFAIDGVSLNTKSSASGFPMYDRFSGSDRSQYSRTSGTPGPFGVGIGGGGGVGPIGTEPANPVVPVVPVVATPEPGTLLLLLGGLLTLGGFARRRTSGAAETSN